MSGTERVHQDDLWRRSDVDHPDRCEQSGGVRVHRRRDDMCLSTKLTPGCSTQSAQFINTM